MLHLHQVTKRFGEKTAVGGVSFEVQTGETFGLLGPNGAGKSTTIAMISGLLEPDSGQVLVNGHDVVKAPRAARQVMGVVPQDIALYPTLTARENLNFWGTLYGLGGKELASRVDEALEIVALTDRQKERVETYSGGMKRRINIAASLLHRPRLLIMDEPTVGIDPQSRNAILETVKRLNAESGMTVIYTSHYMEEVEYLCQRLAIIDHGQLIAQGALPQVRRMAGSQVTVRLKVSDVDDALVAALRATPGVTEVSADGEELTLLVSETAEALAPAIAVVGQLGKRVLGAQVQEPNLESVFLHLTGRALRD